MKQFRYLNSIIIFLFLAALITGVFVIKSESTEPVPPCDEYLEWCIDWCAEHNPDPQNYQQCLNECARKWLEWCT